MSDETETKVGTMAWRDLTVPAAASIRDFYKTVVGWESQDVEMKGYSDFNMIAPDSGESVAGICHARGPNAGLPAQWLMYVVVEDVERSAASCVALGGKVLREPRALGGGRVCVIEDPAGAVCALYTP